MRENIPSPPSGKRRLRWYHVMVLLGLILAFVYGWQQEILNERMWTHESYYWPFFSGGAMDVWLARDYWYVILAIAWALFGIGLWFWED